jgi:Arc/MetJ-type ribon-helix-helix transcriptional regulator
LARDREFGNVTAMKSLVVEVPDQIASEVQRLVAGGWFQNESDVARQALIEFVRARHVELQEQFQREDIAWAVAESKPTS